MMMEIGDKIMYVAIDLNTNNIFAKEKDLPSLEATLAKNGIWLWEQIKTHKVSIFEQIATAEIQRQF
jgi:hypothetical protein